MTHNNQNRRPPVWRHPWLNTQIVVSIAPGPEDRPASEEEPAPEEEQVDQKRDFDLPATDEEK